MVLRGKALSKILSAILALTLSASPALALQKASAPAVFLSHASVGKTPHGKITVEGAADLLANMFDRPGVFGDRLVWVPLADVPECAPEPSRTAASSVADELARGSSLFFDSMNTAEAARVTTAALERHFASPCFSAANPDLHSLACGAAALLVRLLLIQGLPESASSWVSRVEPICGAAVFPGPDIPPDVAAFVHKVASDRGMARQAAADNVRFICGGACPQIFIDGVAVGSRTTAFDVGLPAGRHRIDVQGTEDGRVFWMTATVDFDGLPATFAVLPGVRLTQSGAWSFVTDGDPSAVAGAIGRALDASVVGIVPSGAEGCRLVLLHDRLGMSSGRVLADVVPEGEGVTFTSPAGSPLELGKARKWPWPWVTGSLSVGLLSAGIALNVMQQKTEDSDRPLSRKYGDAAIAGYVTAGAGLLSTILLAVLKPDPDRSVFIAPSASGVSIVIRPGGRR